MGSADRQIYYYDLRNISQPLRVFSGHRKAVSYVKFLANNELASASTDNTLRMWDVKENLPVSSPDNTCVIHSNVNFELQPRTPLFLSPYSINQPHIYLCFITCKFETDELAILGDCLTWTILKVLRDRI